MTVHIILAAFGVGLLLTVTPWLADLADRHPPGRHRADGAQPGSISATQVLADLEELAKEREQLMRARAEDGPR